MDISTTTFRTKGYQIFRELIAKEHVETVGKFLEQKLASAIDTLKPLGIRSELQYLSDDIRRLLAKPDADQISRDLRTTMTGHYPLDVRLDSTLWDIPRDDNVQRMLKSALGAHSLKMHMPPTARFVLPGNVDAGVPSHQDISYNQHMTDFVTMWVPLVEIDDRCGGVTIFEGLGTEQLPTRPNSYGIWNEGLATDGTDTVDCAPMRPGDVLIFNKFTIHKSMPNVSDRIRLSVDYRFFGEFDASNKHYLDLQSWQVIAPNQPQIARDSLESE